MPMSNNRDQKKLSLDGEESQKLPPGGELDASEEESPDQQATENEASTQAEPTGDHLQQQLQQLRQEYDKEHDLHLRAAAELRNYKRRVAQQQAQQMQYAHESLLSQLIPILDHFQLALEASTDESAAEMISGVQMVYEQLMNTLEQFGLQPIEPVGEPFDPQHHEAVERHLVASDDPAAGTVTKVLRPGYRLHQRVLRPAAVKVAVPEDATEDE